MTDKHRHGDDPRQQSLTARVRAAQARGDDEVAEELLQRKLELARTATRSRVAGDGRRRP